MSQAVILENLPHWVYFGGYCRFDLTHIDFESQKFTIRGVRDVVNPNNKHDRHCEVIGTFNSATQMACEIFEKDEHDIRNYFGLEEDVQKMIVVEWCKKTDKTKNNPPIEWNKKKTGYGSKEDWDKWFIGRKANLRDLFEGNFYWHRPEPYNWYMYHSVDHPK
jgi:hypothetical protein